jgi:hypothetical protein
MQGTDSVKRKTNANAEGKAFFTMISIFVVALGLTGLELWIPLRQGINPAVLVAVHYCTGSGPAFYRGTEFAGRSYPTERVSG